MALYTRNIVIDVNSDYEEIFPSIKNSNNSLLDLTGYTFVGELKKHPLSLNKTASFNVSIADTSMGKIKISLGSSITQNINPGRYSYDVLMNTGSKLTRIFEGSALATPGVTTAG
jgi:hypothetical protein